MSALATGIICGNKTARQRANAPGHGRHVGGVDMEKLTSSPRLFEQPTPVLDALAADGFGHWLAGFIDGEGCFYMQVLTQQSRPTGRPCHYLEMNFKIGVRGDEEPIMREIQRRTGIGKVRRVRATSHVNPSVRWEVDTHAEVPVLIAILDRFQLRAKKSADYTIWRKTALAYIELRRANKRGTFDPTPYVEAVAALREGRAFKGGVTYGS